MKRFLLKCEVFPPKLVTPPIETETAPGAKTAPGEETAPEETAPGEDISPGEKTTPGEETEILKKGGI